MLAVAILSYRRENLLSVTTKTSAEVLDHLIISLGFFFFLIGLPSWTSSTSTYLHPEYSPFMVWWSSFSIRVLIVVFPHKRQVLFHLEKAGHQPTITDIFFFSVVVISFSIFYPSLCLLKTRLYTVLLFPIFMFSFLGGPCWYQYHQSRPCLSTIFIEFLISWNSWRHLFNDDIC